ncbi:MAG: hypothetical protein QGF59_20320 [Pirellulaceae bacterium]|jgi:hypothetical protein|nr:hypothetical protein [Pirellulaceae bacterium]
MMKQGDDGIVLKDARDKVVLRIPTRKIDQFVPWRLSHMPDLLIREMTTQQVTDLLSSLSP